jgi:general secretion pathway protein G
VNATVAQSSRRDYSRHVGVGLIVLAALLLSLLFVRPFGQQVEIRERTKAAADMQGIGTQLKLYKSMNGFFPTAAQGLQALATKPTTAPTPVRWYQLFPEIPVDPWKTPYIYRCPGTKHPESFDLFSAGPDRQPDTKDDVWYE